MNKIRSLFIAAFVLLFSGGFAQSVMSTAGSVSTGDNIQLEWTVGETFINQFSYSDNSFTEGYHQPAIKVSTWIEQTDSKYHFSISPNPTVSTLNFISESIENMQIRIVLTDILGKTISLTSATTNDSKSIDLSAVISGIYMLSIKNEQGIVLQTFRVVKAN